jgi:5,10-methylenetetrahydromethanopterin reductase
VILSCAFPPSVDSPGQVQLAEHLGYHRAWLYDSPALYHDVWMALARCADRTSSIGLGPAVLIPSLRHPMVNASAIASLCEQAPGRVAVAVGAGFTGRMTMGKRALAWRDVAAYVGVLRTLLAGGEAEWDGAVIRMLHPAGFGPPRPVEVAILIGAEGPKGLAVAAEIGDGVFSAGFPQPDAVEAAPWRALLGFGTVFDDGEDFTSTRVLDTLAPIGAVLYHATYERGADAVDALPGGRAWREALESVPLETRHLALHAGHLVEASPLERASTAELAPVLASTSLSGSPEQVRRRVDELAAAGVTEVAFQPVGDIERELRAFAGATIGAGAS